MTINIDIYCKKEPDVNDLVKPLKFQKEQVMQGYDFYKFIPEGSNNGIWVVLDQSDPKIYTAGYGQEDIEDRVLTAKKNGFKVPKEFIAKVKRDCYNVRADEELANILNRYPELKQGFPDLNMELNLAEFSSGEKLYSVELEAKQFASQDTIEAMTGLATYFSKAFDGIVYEDQTNRFGIPDPKELNSIGMGSFFAIMKDVKKKGVFTPSEEL